MKLYGVAVAAIPINGRESLHKLHCTTLYVEDGKRDEAAVVPELSYVAEFNVYDDADFLEKYFQLVYTMHKALKLHKSELRKNGFKEDDADLSLHIGEDGRNPLIKERFESLLLKPKPYPYLDEKRLCDSEEYYQAYKKRIISCDGIISEFRHDFKLIAKWANEIIHNSKLLWGSFTGGSIEINENTEPKAIDFKLRDLKARLDNGDLKALKELKDVARDIGRECGKDNMYFFQLKPLKIVGNVNQLVLNRFHFFDWHPEIRESFHAGFKETDTSLRYRRIKLHTDESKPPYFDPAANMICEEFQVLSNQRKKEQLSNTPNWVRFIKESFAEALAASTRRFK